jgi:hypothetical protein
MTCIKRKETVLVIGELIEDWELSFVIDSVVDNGDGTYTLNVPKTFYLVSGKRRILTINLIDYVILEVVNNESVKLKGTDANDVPLPVPPSDTFNLPVPFYFNGTIVQTNMEIKKEDDLSQKTPMIFLRRPFSETIDAMDQVDTDIANKADITLYFLTEADFAEWSTSEHDEHAIVPMRNLMYEFIEMLKRNSRYIERLSDYQATDQIKFGLVTQNGVTKGLFSDNYSGVEMDISLGIKYQCMCD